jgi:membrane protease subunit HflC
VERKKSMAWVLPGILIVMATILLSSILFTVQEDEIALVVRFSRIERVIDDSPGLHFKLPFIEEVRKLPKPKIFYDVPLLNVLTSDTIAMIADSFVIWRIYDPFLFFQVVNTVSNAESRLDASTFSALQRTISAQRQSEIISAYERSRDLFNQTIANIVREEALEYGIEIIDVKVKRFDLPLENEQAVFRRMISDREQLATQFRATGIYDANIIRNTTDRDKGIIVSDARAEAERIRAEGEEEYMRILANAYYSPERQEFFRFVRGLDAVRESLRGGDNTVILDRDSIIAQILVSPWEED